MNTKILYGIFEITKEENLPDLTIGLAKYRHEHPGFIGHEKAKSIRTFLARHSRELGAAFPDFDAFAAAVTKAREEDQQAMERAEAS